MPRKGCLLIAAILLTVGPGAALADMVILKSGEMFQTSKAWKENGVVSYYRDGRIVRVAEKEVERLIHSRPPADKQPPSRSQSADPPSSSPGKSAANRLPAVRLPAGRNAGYLGLQWGQAPSQIDGLEFLETDPAYGGVRQYIRPKAKMRFGRASVDNIYYGFWQDGLYTILVEVSNSLDFLDLKAESFRRYGERESQEGHPEKYRWTTGGTDRLLVYDYESGTGHLWMRSQALHAKVQARYPE